ncbi:MAG: hypothetical protein K6A65_01100 [Succinivibrionaceae bacterium]|nr:hypothetical protein [Succinivibrionaceae bacterium]
MRHKMVILAAALAALPVHGTLAAGPYVPPPSSATTGHVPVISDEAMEQCVKAYNETLDLQRSLQGGGSPGDYNRKAARYNSLVDWFNANCAGRQSRSACEAANLLNRERGLPEASCR